VNRDGIDVIGMPGVAIRREGGEFRETPPNAAEAEH
jgi:hypothetical protein